MPSQDFLQGSAAAAARHATQAAGATAPGSPSTRDTFDYRALSLASLGKFPVHRADADRELRHPLDLGRELING